MRAALDDRLPRAPGRHDRRDPTTPADGVVLEVLASGVCRSDWHGWQGHDPTIELPHVPGHEMAGRIVEVGPEVRGHRVGDLVTVPFCCGCGRCAQCLAGQTQVCDDEVQPGFTQWGSFAELVALPHADVNLVALPEDSDPVTMAALGCRFMTAWAAAVEHGAVRPDQWVAVHGCGGLGLSLVMVATSLGARVVAVDLDADRLAMARSLGAGRDGRRQRPVTSRRPWSRRPAAARTCPSTPWAARVRLPPRCCPCASGAGTSRSG